ncbi:MAG: M56 family metallopeptidase [Bacillota bacterium]|nr:M56 family metallopeptidase [Bacillota bacterium]
MDTLLQNLFIKVLNMSITGTYMIIFVLLIRFPLKKAPKIFSYSLWGVVLFRLACPYTFSTAFSFLKSFSFLSKTEPVPADIGLMKQPCVDLGVNKVNDIINSSLPAASPTGSVNLVQIILAIISFVWVAGMLAILLYSIVSYIMLKKRIRTAILAQDNVFECEGIQTPFVLGIVKPKIFLPVNLSENEKIFILKHEQTHIKRLDYLVKPIAFLVLCIHWFNPFAWLSFIIMSRDMEMSCDEKVIRELGSGIKREYSSSLLSMAVSRKLISASPLAFGESNVKNRIKNVLNYKKPSFWAAIVLAVLVAVIGIWLISNPKSDKRESDLQIQSYLKYRTEYVGDNSKVGGLINLMTFPLVLSYERIRLGTDEKPYKLTVDFNASTIELDHEMVSEFNLFEKNSIILFSLIKNVDEINYVIDDGARSKTMQFSRDWANKAMNSNVWKSSENEKDFSRFFKKVEAMYSKTASKNVVTVDRSDKEGESFIEYIKNLSVSVEASLKAIISTPLSSSNPNDYISAHQKDYEKIIKYGGKDALEYMLLQFKTSKVQNDLRGQIMMRLCKDLLGPKNNVLDEKLLPLEWYSKLKIIEQTAVPDFTYEGNDTVLKLVYEIETEKHQSMKSNGGFLIVAPHIHVKYEEGNELKVFISTLSTVYNLYDKLVCESSSWMAPAAITYIKNPDGSYSLKKYEQAEEGSLAVPSIKKFCTMPVSGKNINGLADSIIKYYANYSDLIKLNTDNLKELLKENKHTGVSLKTNSGSIVPLT